MTSSGKGMALGGIFALGVATVIAIYSIVNTSNGEKWCRENYGEDSEELNHCLAQNSQGPGWAIGFGIWFVFGAFGFGYVVGKGIGRQGP